MKKLKIPSRAFMHELYQTVARFPLHLSEKDLVWYIQLSRTDHRLAEVITEHLRDFWWKYEPASLNKRLKAQRSPEAVRPMILQIVRLCEAERAVKQDFCRWSSKLAAGLGKVPPQLYFIPSLAPRSKSMDREVFESREEFRECGYFSREILFNKQIPGFIKSYDTAPLNTEARLKSDLYLKIRPHLTGRLETLAEELGVDRTTLSEIRSGKIHDIGTSRLATLMDRILNSRNCEVKSR